MLGELIFSQLPLLILAGILLFVGVKLFK